MSKLFPVLMALTAYTTLSLGFVMMKKGIDWMGWKGPKTRTFYRSLIFWITGFIIMNIYGVPSAIALKTLPPHLVAAFAGWGIVMLVLFSRLMLKEEIHKTDYLYSFLIVVGIFLLGVFEKSDQIDSKGLSFSIAGMILLCIIPVIVFVSGFIRSLSPGIKTACFSAVSGVSAGLMVVALRLLVVQYGYEVSLYFSSLYLYMYIFFALLSFVALQFALKNGSMIEIGPVQYSSNIIYPVCATLLVFQQPVHVVQVISVTLIVYSVISILKKH